ncbi:MAG: hypothetical protein JW864_13995 [Spirochaetes bacterium]|nr:hypothetical protein [Spirochaetota bacterium]
MQTKNQIRRIFLSPAHDTRFGRLIKCIQKNYAVDITGKIAVCLRILPQGKQYRAEAIT